MGSTCKNCGKSTSGFMSKLCSGCKENGTLVNTEIKRFPQFNGWQNVDGTKKPKFSTDQQSHYDRTMAILIQKNTLLDKKEMIKEGFKLQGDKYLTDACNSYVTAYLKHVAQFGVEKTTAELAFMDYLQHVLLSEDPSSNWSGSKSIDFPVFEKWPASGRASGTFSISKAGLKLGGKKNGEVSLNWAEISSLGFGESQYHLQQGARSTVYLALTFTVRAKSGAIYERHLLFGSTEKEINQGRIFVKDMIQSIQYEGYPVRMIDDNGYSASGGYTVGVGVWFK